MTYSFQMDMSERQAEDQIMASGLDEDSYCSDDSSSSSSSCSSWDSDMDDLEASIVSTSILHLKTQSSPVISSMQKKTEYSLEPLMTRMRKCESYAFQSPQVEPVSGSDVKPDTKPEDLLDKVLRSNGISSDMLACAEDSFLEVTEDHVTSYNAAAKAAREGEIGKLRKLHSEGICLQASNVYGETIVHLVCRRGANSILRFLLDINVSVRVRDDYGRTPLHDAAWTDKPNFELVHQLLVNSPDLLLVKDKRGNSPLAYVPMQRRAEWCRFLETHEELIEAALESKYTLSV